MANKIIVVDDGGFVDIDQFKEYLDVEKIYYYVVKLNKDKTITLKFYDKKKKLVKPYAQK
jgi:hypothetical protein